MDKKQIWLALAALGITAPAPGPAAEPEKAGVAGQLNPEVEGQLSGQDERVLFVGSDVYRNETISTGDNGQVHLRFLDQSSLTVGPNSQIVLDRFVYDPETGAGELIVSATKGVMRFVGGALSNNGDVEVKTPVGSLGIRGAIVIVEIARDSGAATSYLLSGESITATSLEGLTKKVAENEHRVTLYPDGNVEVFGPVNESELDQLIVSLQGPNSDNPPDPQRIALPSNFEKWLQLIDGDKIQHEIGLSEKSAIDAANRDVDNMAS